MSILNSTTLDYLGNEDNRFVAGAVGVAAVLATTAAYYALGSKDEKHDFPKLRGIQLYHAWNFFQRRHDFLKSSFERSHGESFSFNVLHHNVVALAGEDVRRVFFSHPGFDLDEGYRIFKGAAPRVRDVNIATEKSAEIDAPYFNAKLNQLLNGARIRDVLPTLLQDVINKADKWENPDGETSRIDPFIEIYDLVFVMTARMTACRDLTNNEGDLKRIRELFLTLRTSATPTSLVFPWFPSQARKTGKQATTELYTLLYTYVETRRHAELTSDAIDVLIADGETTQKIVGFVMMVLFTGILNTGIISCWMLIDLATHPEWREKCKGEMQGLLSGHLGDSSPEMLSEKLGAIPLSVWEDELPVIEACIRESHRISGTGTAIRRNLREDMKIGEQVVKRGDFLVYSMGDVHLNPEYYPEPDKYDPGRWLRPDPLPDAPYTFLGWGAGRHPCTGMRAAKLEMKLVMALFLTRYEFDIVDKDGKFPNPLPIRNKNDNQQARPLGDTCYFNFKKVTQ